MPRQCAVPRKRKCPEHGSAMPWMTNRICGPPNQPKRATSEIRPNAQLLNRLASSAPLAPPDPAISTVHGVDFAFLRRTVLRTAASDSLHQYWDECLNLGQSVTVTEVCRYGGLLVVADRDRPNVAKAPPGLTPPLSSRMRATPWHTRCT